MDLTFLRSEFRVGWTEISSFRGEAKFDFFGGRLKLSQTKLDLPSIETLIPTSVLKTTILSQSSNVAR